MVPAGDEGLAESVFVLAAMITLRGKQPEAMTLIREAFAALFLAVLYVAPCGFGKTVLFSAIAESAARRLRRVLILCHRVELVDQIVETLRQFGIIPDIIAAGYTRRAGWHGQGNHVVTVASVQTLVRRLEDYPAPTLICIDECHHAISPSWSAIIRKYPAAKILGVTASPIRFDSRGLAPMFDKMIVGPSVKELTEDGFLAPVRIFAPPTVDVSGLHIRAGDYKVEEAESLMDTPAIIGSALGHYRKHADGKPALVFCTSVAHAHHVAEQFRKDGIAALALDGGTDKQVRRMAVDDFRNGSIRVISQCGLANEGWDLPGVHCGIFLRPTQSLGLWIQMMGRCSRLSPGKTHAVLLDHVGNCQRLGLPDQERDWKLTADIIHKKKAKPGIRVCPKCFAASPARARTCVECGHVFEVQARQEVEEREGELVELTAEQIAKRRERQAQGMTKDLASLIAWGRKKGYKDPAAWASYIIAGREAKKRKKENRDAAKAWNV